VISRLGAKLSGISERFVPDPLIFALVLTFFTFFLGVSVGGALDGMGVAERAYVVGSGWFAELYNTGLMKFAMQMCLVLIAGHALALSRPIRAAVMWISGRVNSARAAAVVVLLVACAASLIQWGLGAIVGALMAREMGRALKLRGIAVHYPVLGAAGYAGFVVWHGGLSGSAPLKVAEKDHFLVDAIGVIPVTETIFAPMNLVITSALVVTMALTVWALMPSDGVGCVEAPDFNEFEALEKERRSGWVGWLEDGPILSRMAGSAVVLWILTLFVEQGASAWGLDSINLLFVGLGLLLHRSPMGYLEAVLDGARGAAAIILQFPLYFGILGILKSSGLIEQVSSIFIALSTDATYPILTFLSAGLVNFFVPSGGGQWAVQGPLMVQGLQEINVPATTVVMALSYGDAWTNMLQPFWALPLLGIMGLRARDIMGYTALIWIMTGPVVIFGLLLMGI